MRVRRSNITRQSGVWSCLRRRQRPRDALLVGLGNPGEEYAGTRHNAGFMVIDSIAAGLGASFTERFGGEMLDCPIDGRRVVLAKPGTYVNRSGQYLAPALSRFKVGIDNLLVLHDDITLELGKSKFKFGGGASGHGGLLSIIEQLNTEDFYRLRIGIGQPEQGASRVDWVLARFPPDELVIMNEVIERCSTALRDFATQGGVAAMNLHNRRLRRGKGVAN